MRDTSSNRSYYTAHYGWLDAAEWRTIRARECQLAGRNPNGSWVPWQLSIVRWESDDSRTDR